MKREGEMDQCGMSRRVRPDLDRERESWTEYEKKKRVELQME
jgi:hypothetical protein